jgi:hypothetical protein
MKKVTILLPTHYNDGSIVEEYKLENALNRIADIAGGYTLDGIVIDCWQNPETCSPRVAKRETMQKVWVVGTHMTEQLHKLCQYFAVYFNQKCIYFEVGDVDVQFITRE